MNLLIPEKCGKMKQRDKSHGGWLLSMGVIKMSKLLIGSPTIQGMFYVTNEIVLCFGPGSLPITEFRSSLFKLA